MVVGEASIHNIMGGMESTGGVRLHNHKRKLKQRFDIIKKVGQGNYGKVQLGINKETGQEVAIKTIKKCKFETEADLIRIRREIQIMSSVQHPNIIHIYEVFENKEKIVLVMEYAAGGELFDYLNERKGLSEQEARRIFRQISIAVFYCHKHKICHRDLKLENILLDQLGNAKIADFGLSNVFDEQRLLHTFCGSPLYASPEIVKGTPYHGPEVDCWSLGVLLYTLVYGAMPFANSNFTKLTEQISQSDFFEPKIPSPASPLIKELLTNCPARRADIEKVCSHWWVNEGYEQNCLDIAEDLAAQTPVRLDLLLSLVPQSASADKLVVGDQRASGEVVNNMSTDTLVPTRCHSVGSLMELDRNNSDRRVREMVEEEPRAAAAGDSKRKLETTPSMDETPSLKTGVKRKERARKKDKSEESTPRAHRFTSNRHHSAPIAHPITEEAMEVDPSMNENASKPQLDLRNDETASACLELIKESLSKSPSKERSKTPVAPDQSTVTPEKSPRDVNENVNDAKPMNNKLAGVQDKSPDQASPAVTAEPPKAPAAKKEMSTKGEVATEPKIEAARSEVPNKDEAVVLTTAETNDKVPTPVETDKAEGTSVKDAKKLKQKALSLDCDLSNDVAVPPTKPVERRRSKIFETAEKFNQLAAGIENDKPKKIFIPGVNVGGAKRAFERKASLSSIVVPQTVKQSASKVIIDVPNEKKNDKNEDKQSSSTPTTPTADVKDENLKREEEKKRAVDIITGAIGKPPVMKKLNGSPPITPQSPESKKLALKIPVGPNDLRNATISVSTPVDTKFPFETKPATYEKSLTNTPESQSLDNSYSEEPTMSSKMEITLKSATLPRPRKTSKAEITLSGIKSPEGAAFKSEVEAKIDAFHPQKLRTQRSEVAFPVAAVVPQANRSSSLEPEGASKIPPKERIIPIQVESDHQQQRQTSTPPPKPPMPQRSMSQRSGSLSRQSTVDSDTDSALGSTIGPEPIRKSPREYIIPIAVEGGGYVTPRSGSVEPESKTSTPTSASAPRSRFGRPRRMSSLLSDASEDESPFSTLHRDSDDLLQRHMHRLRSSRPTRQLPEHADSLSSGEDDDDDGFELLTAENLFSTLLSRVRSLTQRLNVDDNRGSGFPSSRLLGRLGSNSSQGFWGLHEPLSRRLTESPFRRSMSRETDRFGKRDSAVPSNSGTPSSPGARSTPSRESIFEMGSSNTLPRDRKSREDNNETTTASDSSKARRDAQDSLEQSFTPSLARRLSRQFIEQTRQSLPRSPSIPREKLYRSSTEERSDADSEARQLSSTISDQTEYRSRSCDRGVRRTNSLLEASDRADRFEHRSPRRSVSLFDDEDESLPPLPRQSMTLGRKYRDSAKPGPSGGMRRDSFHNYRTEKIQEESPDEFANSPKANNGSSKLSAASDCCSSSNSNTNLVDTASSTSARSCETSPTESSSTLADFTMPSYKPPDATTREFENRLLAAENLIKASKLRNLSPGKFDPNLSSSYKDTDKCDKELLGSMTDISGALAKRRSCIPSLRLRSGSLTREASLMSSERRKTLSCSQDSVSPRGATPERSILSKFFRAGSSNSSSSSKCENPETKEKSPKPKGQRRISRFLRPDFFDTPREESQYVKDKEAQKAAENERRKSRFMKKKSSESKNSQEGGDEAAMTQEKPEKELKNEANAITRDKTEALPKDNKSENEATSTSGQNGDVKFERQSSKNSFLQTLEKKLEKFRSSDEGSKVANGSGPTVEGNKGRSRENSAPPVECLTNESALTKRAISVEDLPISDPAASTSKRRVSSVLGLFKNDSSKPGASGQRPQNTILSKFKRNAYKGSRSDSLLSSEAAPAPSGSKIPTKFAKVDAKTPKKLSERKKSPEQPEKSSEPSKSPTKEKSPPERLTTTKKSGSVEKQILKTIAKKVSPDKSLEGKTDKPEKSSKLSETMRKTSSPEKSTENKSVASRLAMAKKLSPEKTPDNRQTEAKCSSVEVDEKKIVKTKKNVKSLTSLVKNGSVTKLEKSEEEKKVKKVVKSKDAAVESKDISGDGAKKKKIVRVVKKVVKKSDSSDSKSDDKEKATTKTSMKKITSSTTKKDSSPESSGKSKEKSPDSVGKSKDKCPESLSTGNKDRSPESLSTGNKDRSPESLSTGNKDRSPESLSTGNKDRSPESLSTGNKDRSPESLSTGNKDRSPESLSTGNKDRSPESLSTGNKDRSPESLSTGKDRSPENLSTSKDKSPENLSKIKDKYPESMSKIKDKYPESLIKIKEKSPDEKPATIIRLKTLNSPPQLSASPTTSQMTSEPLKIDAAPIKAEIPVQQPLEQPIKEPESKPNGSIPNIIHQISEHSDCKNSMTSLGAAKSIRGNLKLDLSKIPQHSFKSASTLKKEFFKSEPTNSKPKISTLESPKHDEAAGKLIDSLGKMTHRASTGSKIEALRTSHTDLQLDSVAPEARKSPERPLELSDKPKQHQEDPTSGGYSREATNFPPRPSNLPLEAPTKKSPPGVPKDHATSETDDMFSPLDDNESFDSWSICSADLNHRHDLHSPTSPSYSPSSRGDHPESIIDRIRRKSFYSRFNERKRKSSLNVPPPGVTLPSSTLPRKYSFNSTRDKDYGKPNSYASSRRQPPERSYSLYNDESPSYRKSPVDRDRYSDVGSLGSFSSDLKSPSDQYGSLGSCYDPLRRYRISPTPEPVLLGSQRKYQSTDYGLDHNVGSYKSRLSPSSFLNDSGLESSYSGRSMLPRKYGSVSSCPEAKTADYYEELLTPTRSDYLSARKTPVPSDYVARHENGYHNGNLDAQQQQQQSEADKWKTYTEKIAGLDLTDGSDGRLDKQMRSSAGKDSETRDLPASSTETDAGASKAE